MSRFAYPARIEQGTDGRVLVRFRDFDAAATDGADVEEASAEAVDLLESLVAFTMSQGDALPLPSAPKAGDIVVEPSIGTQMQLEVLLVLRERDLTIDEAASRVGLPPSELAALVDLANHPPVADLERTLLALGRRYVVTTVAAE